MSLPSLQIIRTRTDGGEWMGKGDSKGRCVVYAWWAGYGEGHQKSDGPGRMEHVYVSRLQPTAPLEIGKRVVVVAMANGRKAEEGQPLEYYEPYDPHVAGVVEAIRELTVTWIRVTIRNHCRGNTVGRVSLDIPHIPSVTVERAWIPEQRGRWEWIGRIPAAERGRVTDADEDRWCGAGNCDLEELTGQMGGCFRTRKGRGGPKIERDTAEGEFRLHLWLKYEGY